jgi:hypothetical protein
MKILGIERLMHIETLRGDAAIYSEGNIEYFEANRQLYRISAALSGKLPGRIMELSEDDWVEGEDERGRPFSISRITYKSKFWEKACTFIFSHRLKKDAWRDFFSRSRSNPPELL